MASIDFKFLILKAAFLVAMTSAKRASELAALLADPPFIQFHPDEVTLYFDVSFLPKVVSDFHLNQPIILPCSSPHLRPWNICSTTSMSNVLWPSMSKGLNPSGNPANFSCVSMARTRGTQPLLNL